MKLKLRLRPPELIDTVPKATMRPKWNHGTDYPVDIDLFLEKWLFRMRR
ncbi:hypothetical protein [Brevibacillus sp. NRS-1366]